jgi:hypothetical protein
MGDGEEMIGSISWDGHECEYAYDACSSNTGRQVLCSNSVPIYLQLITAMLSAIFHPSIHFHAY